MATRKLINIKAETRVILALLDGTKKMQSKVLLAAPSPEFFGYGPTREIYERIMSLKGKDIPTSDVMMTDAALSEEATDLLQNPGAKRPKKMKTLKGLLQNLDVYRIYRISAEMTSDVSKMFSDSKERGSDADLAERLVGRIEKSVVDAKIKDRSNRPFGVGQGTKLQRKKLHRILQPKHKGERIVPTGLMDFDAKTRGIRKGAVTVLAANSGGMKTTLAKHIVVNQYKKYSKSTAFVTFEMEEDEVISDVSSEIAGILCDKIENEQLSAAEAETIERAWDEFNEHGEQNNCRFEIFALSDYMTPRDVEALLSQGRYDVWVVDYIQLLKHGRVSKRGDEGELWQKLGEIVRDFKLIAKRNKVAIILIAQADEGRKIRYAKMIIENADNILYWMYNSEHKGIGPNGTGIIKIETMKGRRFGEFYFYLEADPAYKTFRAWKGDIPEIFTSKKKKRKGARSDEESMESA